MHCKNNYFRNLIAEKSDAEGHNLLKVQKGHKLIEIDNSCERPRGVFFVSKINIL